MLADRRGGANVGDIVAIDGYDDMEFEVISVERIHYQDRTIEYEVYEYETLGLEDGRNYFASDEDITVLRRKEQGEVFTEDVVDIDALLDEMTSIRTVSAIMGEEEKYASRLAEIKAKLKEATTRE